MYSENKLSEGDVRLLRCGICPKRINGTMMMGPKEPLHHIDISKPAQTDAGVAIVSAIEEYSAKYHGTSRQ